MTQSIDLEILNKLNKITGDIGVIKKAIDKIPDLAEKVGELIIRLSGSSQLKKN
ncbi:MAG: hypothetical protein RLZZ04_2462 [Cyanobacteriota bacterium]|jgi:copper homeostasis protein CutC